MVVLRPRVQISRSNQQLQAKSAPWQRLSFALQGISSNRRSDLPELRVRKPNEDDKCRINNKQSTKKYAIVSQVNHKNVVKLLGELCLPRPKSFSWFMNLFPLEGSLNTSINIEKSVMLKSRKARLRISTERGVHQVGESAQSTQSRSPFKSRVLEPQFWFHPGKQAYTSSLLDDQTR